MLRLAAIVDVPKVNVMHSEPRHYVAVGLSFDDCQDGDTCLLKPSGGSLEQFGVRSQSQQMFCRKSPALKPKSGHHPWLTFCRVDFCWQDEPGIVDNHDGVRQRMKKEPIFHNRYITGRGITTRT